MRVLRGHRTSPDGVDRIIVDPITSTSNTIVWRPFTTILSPGSSDHARRNSLTTCSEAEHRLYTDDMSVRNDQRRCKYSHP